MVKKRRIHAGETYFAFRAALPLLLWRRELGARCRGQPGAAPAGSLGGVEQQLLESVLQLIDLQVCIKAQPVALQGTLFSGCSGCSAKWAAGADLPGIMPGHVCNQQGFADTNSRQHQVQHTCNPSIMQ
jgi:hypothetical protein